MALPPSLAGLTLTQLAYVVAVDTHRHFGRAAAACHVTQPTLSMQLGKLERLLGVALFDRGRAPVVPTEAGRRVAERARHVLREAARIAEAATPEGDAVAGELRLGVIPTVAPYLLPAVVHDLGRRHPRLALVIEERTTDDALAAVRAGTLDAAVVATDAAGADLAETPLFTEPFVAYVGARHRLAARRTLAPADLALDDLWLLSEGHCLRTQALRLCGARRAERGERAGALGARFESGNLETLARLVERGDGMTLLPALAAADVRARGAQGGARLIPFTAPAPSRGVRLVRPRASGRARTYDAVVAALTAAGPTRAGRRG